MPQLLIELFSEEIPARMQAQAARDFERMARDRLAAQGLLPEALTTFAGPRRLTLVAEGLPAAQGDRHEELKGPKVGAPDQAIDGFLRKTGLTRDELTQKDGVWFAHIHRAGRPTPQIVAEMVEEIVRTFPWPKSMTWGYGSLRWVRPLKRILCVFDGEVVPFSIDGIEAGDTSEGHRFMGSAQPFKARNFDQYAEGLEKHFVVLDPESRRTKILEQAKTLCFARNLELVDDEGLLDEVSGLAEWPTPVLGEMDPAFLDLPPEVIRTSMRTHQKYFAVRDPATGKLAANFVTVANIEAQDGGRAIAAGNARVLSARLNDARFFWDEDRKVKLEDRLEKLKGVTFHAKLGTLYERVERITALAGELAPLVGAEPSIATVAARLCKADLVTGMVGEFPELQGVMGRYYLRAEAGLPSVFPNSTLEEALRFEASDATRIAVLAGDAIRDHYKPQGPTDETPIAPVSRAVALAEKLDTLVGFFAIDEKPTGSKDPYALRRAALGVIRIVLEGGLRLSLREVFAKAQGLLAVKREGTTDDLLAFFIDRLKVALRDRGLRHDLVEAAVEGDDDLGRIVARVEALSSFLATEDGKNLLAGYKRAGNILKAEERKGALPSGAPLEMAGAPAQETALVAAISLAEPEVARALQHEDFAGAMRALSGMRTSVDAFFEGVLVNSEVAAERENRLRLLAQVRDAMGKVADFSLVNG